MPPTRGTGSSDGTGRPSRVRSTPGGSSAATRACACRRDTPSSPTSWGYELFSGALPRPPQQPAPVVGHIERTLHRSTRDDEQVLQEARRLLPSLPEQRGLAGARSGDGDRLTRLALEPMGGSRAL